MKLNKFVILSMLGSFALPVMAADAQEAKQEVAAVESAAEVNKAAPAKVAKKSKKACKKACKKARKKTSFS